MEPWNNGTITVLCQVLKMQNVKFVPVFDVYQNKFPRYELPVNHENNIKS
jgi:hypothetical protein